VSDENPEETTWGLVMPFVVVKSVGGELDDLSFACGWDCGALDTELHTCHELTATPRARYVKVEILQQLDLIAMRHGFTVQLGDESPGWRHVSFTPVDPHAEPEGEVP
jgi:hypothetical protein